MTSKLSLIFFCILFGSSSLAQLSTHKVSTIYGSRTYKFFAAPKGAHKAKTLVAIHGCKQDAESFALGSHLIKSARERGFNLLLPEQKRTSNPYNCWNWFLALNQLRAGEPYSIIKAMDDATKRYSLDKKNFYVMGMSSGGGMSNILLNCYPERFQAGASHSGVPYASTVNPLLAKYVLKNGMDSTPYLTALKGRICSSQYNGGISSLIIQGSEDEVVAPLNLDDISEQFIIYNKLSSIELTQSTREVLREDGYSYSEHSWKNNEKNVEVKSILINSLGHEWSGGNEEFPYNQEKGPSATKLILDFFKL